MHGTSVYFTQWVTLIAVFSLAVISPGPDFIVAVRNSIVHSRRAGIMTALGFGLGVLVHVTYVVFGIAVVIAQSILVFNLIKVAGAAYLVYIGVKALRSQGMGAKVVDQALAMESRAATMGDMAAIRSGFLTNVLNPKATLFFLAVFSQIISPSSPLAWKLVYGLTCFLLVTAWFSLVALVLNHGVVRNRFLGATKWLDRICGVLLVALGVRIALTTR